MATGQMKGGGRGGASIAESPEDFRARVLSKYQIDPKSLVSRDRLTPLANLKKNDIVMTRDGQIFEIMSSSGSKTRQARRITQDTYSVGRGTKLYATYQSSAGGYSRTLDTLFYKIESRNEAARILSANRALRSKKQ